MGGGVATGLFILSKRKHANQTNNLIRSCSRPNNTTRYSVLSLATHANQQAIHSAICFSIQSKIGGSGWTKSNERIYVDGWNERAIDRSVNQTNQPTKRVKKRPALEIKM
eukprot:Gregarina_sp_Pseudo_9__5736@NODE_838_length_2145_cov_89_155271_g786_i0_p2_GENE_NODE_838_length_2145_cov_89_155271_g786_i0NODE_838_length_2145_cov_89_155271_g786_i0_p2_ORF_typecomplete_len110_score1_07RNase_P_Rpp14/PF01900_19/0_14_NODE_838_length_2145_cov_89_155271_g786_i0263592